jgi:ATP phosphoribosyltransferase
LSVARRLLEFTEAYQRAQGSFTVTANIRGDSAEAIAQRIFAQTNLSGLQGPTISQVFPHESHQNGGGWYAINIVVPKETLFQAIDQLRNIGGSGVIVTPCAYIFEEEPVRYQAMLAALTDDVM